MFGRGIFKPNWVLRASSNQPCNKACVLWKWLQRWLREMCCPPCLHLLGPCVPASQVPCLVALSFHPPRDPRSPSPSSLHRKLLFIWKHALFLFHWMCYYLNTLGSVLSTAYVLRSKHNRPNHGSMGCLPLGYRRNLVWVLPACLYEQLSLFCLCFPALLPVKLEDRNPFSCQCVSPIPKAVPGICKLHHLAILL